MMEVMKIGTTWLLGREIIARHFNDRHAGTGIKVDPSADGCGSGYTLTVEGISRRQVDRLICLIRAELGREAQP
jgi:hypothetical protein